MLPMLVKCPDEGAGTVTGKLGTLESNHFYMHKGTKRKAVTNIIALP